jgi:hypothetical protein
MAKRKNETIIKTIDELENLKPGQLILFKSFTEDVLGVFASKQQENKYPIIENGKKYRSDGYNSKTKKIKLISAASEGASGDEKIYEYTFLDEHGVSLTLDEHVDLKLWNIRLIDNTHPRYNNQLVKTGKEFYTVFGTEKNILNSITNILNSLDLIDEDELGKQ